MKSVKTKFGIYVDQLDIDGVEHSVFADDDYWNIVKDGKLIKREFAPGAESALKNITPLD